MINKTFNSLIQWARRKGITYLFGCNVPGQGIQSFSLTSTGTPDTVVLADVSVNGYPLSNMQNLTYQVLTDGETVADTAVDESTKTTTGFNVTGGAAGEVIHVVVIGTLAGMPDNTD